MQQKLLRWELAGVVFIVVSGTLLHFVFEWSGCFHPLALIAAVNESTWEHLKMAFWPALFWALLEYIMLRCRFPNFLVAKTISLYVMPLLIVVLVNAYTMIIGHHILMVDILIFCLAVTIGQWVSYRLLKHRPFCPLMRMFSLILLVIIISAFSLFTYYPPDLPLFTDPRTGQQGISPTCM